MEGYDLVSTDPISYIYYLYAFMTKSFFFTGKNNFYNFLGLEFFNNFKMLTKCIIRINN